MCICASPPLASFLSWSVPLSPSQPSEVQFSVSGTERQHRHVSIHIRGLSLGATQKHQSPTTHLLVNGVIPLNAASKLHFCFREKKFLSSPPTSAAGLVRGQASTDCLAAGRDWMGTRCISEAGDIDCIPNGYTARTGEHWMRRASMSGREGNSAQQGTTEIRRNSMQQQHRRALLQPLRVLLFFILLWYNNADYHTIHSRFNELMFNVGHVLKAWRVCICTTLVLLFVWWETREWTM